MTTLVAPPPLLTSPQTIAATEVTSCALRRATSSTALAILRGPDAHRLGRADHAHVEPRYPTQPRLWPGNRQIQAAERLSL
ncbi:MAG TPA: hypothetical protein VNU46_07195 [Gemmatimonadaceae bacterium]|nr:hypothetical protein [Gemmatimonadaceae bacterium]